MKAAVTYDQILAHHQELTQLKMSGSIRNYWDGRRISEFYDKNGHHVNHILKEMEKVKKKYVQYSEPSDNIPAKPMTTGTGNEQKYIFLEGMDEKEFEKEINDLVSEKVFMII